MRVALLVRRLSTHGGTERFVCGLSRWLAAAGHDPHVWCTGADAGGAGEGVTVHHLRAGGRGHTLKLLSLDRASRRIPYDDYDIVLGFVRAGRSDLYRAGGGCHEAWMAERPWRLADEVERELDRRVVLGARRVVVNSRMAADDLLRLYGLPAERVRLVRNGVDLRRFRPDTAATLPVPGPAFVFLGSGFARKGLDTAIRALARVPGAHLAVLGTDAHEARFRRFARRAGVADRVHFLGAVDAPEEVLPAARGLVLPTRYDPSANACLEALACGIPAITSGRNGACEVLPEPWMRVADPADVEGFTAAMERALHTPGLAVVCRSAAEEWPAQRAFARMAALAEELALERRT